MIARLITLCFLLPLFTFSQSNFKKAYYVNNENDTIRGFVNYKEEPGNPRSFSFRASETAGETAVLSISQVRYVSIEGYQDFERHLVSISMNELTMEGVNEADESDRSDTVLLRVILKGNNLDMFSYTDKLKSRYYVKESAQASPVELQFRQDRQKTLPLFQRQLTTLAIKYNKLSDQLNSSIQGAQYTRPAISRIVSRINDHAKENFSETKDKKQKLRLFLGAGINYTRLTYTGQNVVTYEHTSSYGGLRYVDRVTNTFYVPSLSFGVDLFSNPDIQRLIIRNEISASFFKSENRSVYQFYQPDEQVAYTYKLSVVSLAYTPQLIYNFYNGKNFKWNLGTGPSFFFWNYPVNETHQQPLSQGSTFSDMVTPDYMKLNKTTVGLIVRSGVMLNNKVDIAIKALINPSTISNKERTTTMKVSHVNLGVNYLFTRNR